MRENCGIIALDALLKEMNLNMSRISLDTLAKICRDNGRLMFPIKIPKNKIFMLPCPYILQTNNHYEAIVDETALSGIEMDEYVYILYPQLNPQIIPHIIDEDEAKGIKGACSDGVKNIPIIGPIISKPARALPLAVSAGGTMLGMPALATNLLGATVGGIQGATTGLYGDKGNILKGASIGFGESLLGRGVGGALSPAQVGVTGVTNPAWKGFQAGFEQSIPFKNALFGTTTPITGSWNTPKYDIRVDPTTQRTYYVAQGSKTPFYSPMNQVTSTGEKVYSELPGTTLGTGGGGTAAGGKSSLLPYLLMGAGSLIPQPEYAGVSEEEMIARLNKPATEAGAVATNLTTQYMQDPSLIGGKATTDLINSMDAQFKQEYQDTMANYGSQLEGAGYNRFGSDYQNLMAKKGNELTLAHDVQKDAIRQQVWQTQVNAQIQFIANAYGIDQAILQDLINLRVEDASMKYGMSVEKINQLRNAVYSMALMAYNSQLQNEQNAGAMQLIKTLQGGQQ